MPLPKTSPPLAQPTLEIDDQNARITPEALAFCAKEGLLDLLRIGICLVGESFKLNSKPTVTLNQDPDGDEPFVLLEIHVNGTVAESFAAYQVFRDRWIERTPPDLRVSIKLIYYLAD
jgi:hypothetical protein